MPPSGISIRAVYGHLRLAL